MRTLCDSNVYQSKVLKLTYHKFKVDANCYASIHHHDSVCTPNSKCVCLPPKDKVASKEYQCAPAPQVELDYSPAIGSRELTHYFQKSHTFGVSQRNIYNQLPKRACGQLRASSDETQLGWGIHFQRGLSMRRINFVIISLALVGVIFGVIWLRLTRDTPSGLTIITVGVGLAAAVSAYISKT